MLMLHPTALRARVVLAGAMRESENNLNVRSRNRSWVLGFNRGDSESRCDLDNVTIVDDRC